MNSNFEKYWEHQGQALQAYGISKAQAMKVYTDASNWFINHIMFKAQEMITRPTTSPSEALLEGLRYAGITEEEMIKRLHFKWQGSILETMKADCAEQFAEAFPRLTKNNKE